MFDGVADWTVVNIDRPSIGFIAALLVGWVAVVYLTMAFGVRSGELVFSGRHIGRLPAEKRWWGFLYGFGLVVSGLTLLELAGVTSMNWIPGNLDRSAGFVVAAVLGVGTLFAAFSGSRWERMLFVPITLLGSAVAIWLTFV